MFIVEMNFLLVCIAAAAAACFDAAVAAGDAAAAAPVVPAYFVLGDSLVDVGNNNHLFTLAKANFFPYGVDFDTHKATGRFSNGRVAVDYITEALGLPFLNAYLDPATKGEALLKGVNFASSGSGILDYTGKVFGQNMPMSLQLEYMKNVKSQIVGMLGQQKADELINKALFSVVVGSNDYLNNYLIDFTTDSLKSPAEFQTLVLSTLKSQLQVLHEFGARKLHMVSLPPIGCCPQSLAKFGSKNGECIGWVNKMAENYNAGLKAMLSELPGSLSGMKFVYTDTYDSFMDIYKNPQKNGFKIAASACCGVGSYAGSFFCLPGVPSCNNPLEHIFFDEFHPNSKVAEMVAEKALRGGPEVNTPMNLQQLISS